MEDRVDKWIVNSAIDDKVFGTKQKTEFNNIVTRLKRLIGKWKTLPNN